MTPQLSQEHMAHVIERFYHYLRAQTITTEGNGRKFSGLVLNLSNPESRRSIGIGATSIGLSMYGLIANKVDRQALAKEMADYILSKQLTNGSWTISSLVTHKKSLVYTTCFALQGLARFDYVGYTEHIQNGLDWLLQIENEDGGWGLIPAQPSHVHSTSEVLYLFSLIKGTINQAVFLRARNWLMMQRIEDTYWKDEHGTPSAFYTALAYRGLIVHGNFQHDLRKTEEWLIEQLPQAPCREDINYYIPIGKQHIIEPIAGFTRAAIFEALTSDIYTDYNPAIEEEAKHILRQQHPLGYWNCGKSSKEIPTFLNHYICVGLVNYTKYLQRRPEFTLISDLGRYSKLHPLSATVIAIFFLIGVAFSAVHSTGIYEWVLFQISNANEKFDKYSGIANLVGITSVFVFLFSLFYKFIIKRDRQQ